MHGSNLVLELSLVFPHRTLIVCWMCKKRCASATRDKCLLAGALHQAGVGHYQNYRDSWHYSQWLGVALCVEGGGMDLGRPQYANHRESTLYKLASASAVKDSPHQSTRIQWPCWSAEIAAVQLGGFHSTFFCQEHHFGVDQCPQAAIPYAM
jgi:hypothetical protein